MKKNAMLKIAAILMVAVLLTTCAISSTFAKYVTTGSDSDSARVAKWGVDLTVTASGAFVDNYNDKVVCTGTDLVAPGTSNANAVTITAEGTPEVATTVVFADDEGKTGANARFVKLEGWKIDMPAPTQDDPDATTEVEYCPVVFTLTTANGSQTFEFGTGEGKYAKVTGEGSLESAINAAIVTLFEGTYNANEPFDQTLTLGWAWAFGSDDVEAAENVKDTLLGDKADADSAATINFDFSVIIAQANPAA